MDDLARRAAAEMRRWKRARGQQGLATKISGAASPWKRDARGIWRPKGRRNIRAILDDEQSMTAAGWRRAPGSRRR